MAPLTFFTATQCGKRAELAEQGHAQPHPKVLSLQCPKLRWCLVQLCSFPQLNFLTPWRVQPCPLPSEGILGPNREQGCYSPVPEP